MPVGRPEESMSTPGTSGSIESAPNAFVLTTAL